MARTTEWGLQWGRKASMLTPKLGAEWRLDGRVLLLGEIRIVVFGVRGHRTCACSQMFQKKTQKRR